MPAHPTIDDDELISRLTTLFRSVGYEAASLQLIASATGLGKSSLYHRFPEGKPQMAEAVAEAIGVAFGSGVLAPAAETDRPVAERIRAIASNLGRVYRDGRESCLLDVLSINDISERTGDVLRAAATAWIDTFAALAREAGLPRRLAKERAEDAVAAIEGGLVLARATGSNAAFRRALAHLVPMLTEE